MLRNLGYIETLLIMLLRPAIKLTIMQLRILINVIKRLLCAI